MKKLIFISIACILFVSCATTMQHDNKIYKSSSIFSNFNQLGMTKNHFIEKFGAPTNKEMYNQDNDLIETFYYVELLNNEKVIIVTKFSFRNDILFEQKKEDISFHSDKETLEQLESEIQLIKHKVMLIK